MLALWSFNYSSPSSLRYPIPKITYPASAPTTTLTFTLPPIQKPGADEQEAVRADSVTLSGKKQSMWQRTDTYRHLIMEWVPIADMPYWLAFIDYAFQGNSFLYYPDANATAYDEWWLEVAFGSPRSQAAADNWDPKQNVRTISKFELVMRKVPGGLSHT